METRRKCGTGVRLVVLMTSGLMLGLCACGGGGESAQDTGGGDSNPDAAVAELPREDIRGNDVVPVDVVPELVEGETAAETSVEVTPEVAPEAADEPELTGPETLTLLDFKLPKPMAGIVAVSAGDAAAYIFGGDGGGAPLATVVRFVPDVGAEIVDGAVLPQPVKAASAVWAGDEYGAFVFGGMTANGMTEAIQRCEFAGPSCTALDSKLPSKRALTAAFFDGKNAYIMGGNAGAAGPTDQILRFDPQTAKIDVLPEKLPTPRASRIGVVWSGELAFHLGGLVPGGKTGEILQYDPAAGTIVDSGMQLPLPMDGGACAWLGAAVMVFGGETTVSTTDAVLVISPNTSEVKVSDLELPSPRRGGAAAVLNSNVYVFGGTGTAGLLDEILRYSPPGD